MESVFCIPELVCMILTFLEEETLLHARGVCKTWKFMIDNRKSLLEKLFFAPSPAGKQDLQVSNPILGTYFPFVQGEQRVTSAPHEMETCLPWIKFNTIGQENFPSPSPSLEQLTCGFEFLEWQLDENRREAFLRNEANWRLMFTHQPPITHFEIIRITHKRSGDHVMKGEKRFSKDAGLRMGELYDRIIDWYQHGADGIILAYYSDAHLCLTLHRSKGCQPMALQPAHKEILELNKAADHKSSDILFREVEGRGRWNVLTRQREE